MRIMRYLLCLIVYGLVNSSQIDAVCRDTYPRFSNHHTACLKPNGCKIIKRGITAEDIKVILDEHNKYREKIASGGELSRDFSTAANMMQLEWGEELADVSQAHAEQCNFAHDCNECRQVDSFEVGQNLFQHQTNLMTIDKPDWELAMKSYYDEITFTPPELKDNFQAGPWGHFTQVIWAKSWKVGCGYTVFRIDKPPANTEELYTCNYGPTGNSIGLPFYESGKPASKCPPNTEPSKEYPSLCKSKDATGPRDPAPPGKELFRCEFLDKKNCGLLFVPPKTKINKRKVVDGNYLNFVIEPAKKVTIKLMKELSAPKGFCFQITMRKGAQSPSDMPYNELKATTEIKEYGFKSVNDFGIDYGSWVPADMIVQWAYKTSVSVTFSVPENSTTQFFDIKNIIAYSGECAPIQQPGGPVEYAVNQMSGGETTTTGPSQGSDDGQSKKFHKSSDDVRTEKQEGNRRSVSKVVVTKTVDENGQVTETTETTEENIVTQDDVSDPDATSPATALPVRIGRRQRGFGVG